MRKMHSESGEGMVVTSVSPDRELHRDLAIAAVDENAAIMELIRQAIREWLGRREPQRRTK